MNFSDFKMMNISEQALLIWRNGIYLSERSEDDCLIALYGINDFYIEVYYRLQTAQVIKLISFHSLILLEPYLKKINIDSLFKKTSLAICNAPVNMK
jgi:hypothetical protein